MATIARCLLSAADCDLLFRWCFCLFLALFFGIDEAAPPFGVDLRAPPTLLGRRGAVDKSDPLCTAEWTFAQCVPINNKCGRGYKIGTRSGELCRQLQDLFFCTVDCVEEGGRVHVDALFNRTKRGPHRSAKPDWNAGDGYLRDGAPARLVAAPATGAPAPGAAAGDYRTHIPGSLYAHGGCTYRVGRWQNCSVAHLTKQREDRLVSGGLRCLPSKMVEMDCLLNELEPTKCRYASGRWSKCDIKTRRRMQVKTLTSGNPATCAAELRVQRPCYTKTGEERCFYGPWSSWGPCVNSTKVKRRKVLYGQSCDNTTRTSSCHPRSSVDIGGGLAESS